MTLTLEEMEEEAVAKVEKDNQGSNQFRTRTFENILNGTLVEVIFITQKGEKAKNLVHFDPHVLIGGFTSGLATFSGPSPGRVSGFGSFALLSLLVLAA